jgi:hypothetical protein
MNKIPIWDLYDDTYGHWSWCTLCDEEIIHESPKNHLIDFHELDIIYEDNRNLHKAHVIWKNRVIRVR